MVMSRLRVLSESSICATYSHARTHQFRYDISAGGLVLVTMKYLLLLLLLSVHCGYRVLLLINCTHAYHTRQYCDTPDQQSTAETELTLLGELIYLLLQLLVVLCPID